MSDTLPNELPESEWAAFAAIDWADQKHFWKLVAAGSQQPEQGELENTPEAVEEWAQALNQRFSGRPIAVCLEQSRGALLYMLVKYPHLVLFPVHPTTAARYRETFSPSGAKGDPGDRHHCWICCCVIANASADCSPRRWKPVCCSF
jgi:hypothetical protein